ncbi:hypothetical protein G3142_005457, partial [Salmonella enterica subsp. enterica serovar Montevideo]|nr:hypothetical protein [Salmonella enterica subsp. enterica serovar Montevideo]EEK7814430.1 hypothetical protein [Salmonella enterica subsp. enterica serovar Montevideo]
MKLINQSFFSKCTVMAAGCILLSSMNAQGGTLTGYPTSTSSVSLNEVNSGWSSLAHKTGKWTTTWKIGEFKGYIKCSSPTANSMYVSLVSNQSVNGVKLDSCPTWVSFEIKIGQEAEVKGSGLANERLPSRDDWYTVEWGKITGRRSSGGGESSKMTNDDWTLKSRLWVTVSDFKIRANLSKTFKFQDYKNPQTLYVFSTSNNANILTNTRVQLPLNGAG